MWFLIWCMYLRFDMIIIWYDLRIWDMTWYTIWFVHLRSDLTYDMICLLIHDMIWSLIWYVIRCLIWFTVNITYHNIPLAYFRYVLKKHPSAFQLVPKKSPGPSLPTSCRPPPDVKLHTVETQMEAAGFSPAWGDHHSTDVSGEIPWWLVQVSMAWFTPLNLTTYPKWGDGDPPSIIPVAAAIPWVVVVPPSQNDGF